jgi:transposase
MMKAYLLKESLDRLWTYRYEGAALRYLNQWIDQLRWQRLEPFKKLAETLLNHLEGILNYCREPVRFGVVEAVNGNIKALLRRGRGYKNLRYLLLKSAAAGGAQDGIPGSPQSRVGVRLFRFLPRARI